MYALLALAVSFVLVFFTVLIFAGIVLGFVAAGSHAVEWIVTRAAQHDAQQRRTLEDQLRRERARS